ncbi:hypothetical protein SRHO_G00318620 [Serrasalmus rhombeus]
MVGRIYRPALCCADPLIDSSLKANMAAESRRLCADTSGWTALHHHALSAMPFLYLWSLGAANTSCTRQALITHPPTHLHSGPGVHQGHLSTAPKGVICQVTHPTPQTCHTHKAQARIRAGQAGPGRLATQRFGASGQAVAVTEFWSDDRLEGITADYPAGRIRDCPLKVAQPRGFSTHRQTQGPLPSSFKPMKQFIWASNFSPKR